MNRVFVSYSRRNKMIAERLARDLGDAGLDVWIDFRQIHAGEFWQQEIYRGIERAEIVVICLSPDAVVSEWVQREANLAREQGKFIIPVMVADAMILLQETETMRWLLDVHFINFEDRYEEAFPELLRALPGKRRVGAYDDVDVANIPNPFKGLEAFQQTDAPFFFGRETLIRKALHRLRQDRPMRFLAVVGASGSGKSSLVRAGVLPALRGGALPGSDLWRMLIFTPGGLPVDALAQRLSPLIENRESTDINRLLHQSVENLHRLTEQVLEDAPANARVLLVVDQFEEVFTRASETEAEVFLGLLNHAVTVPNGRTLVMITMRADFFDRLSRYPDLAELFEQENMVIVTEMTAAELLRSIEGPAQAVGLVYDEGLPQRILEDVRRQPGSLPLLQYALKELYLRRDGNRLAMDAYEDIGGVQQALAQHAETIYVNLNAAQQAIMRRILLRLVEINEVGEATRRKVDRRDLTFRDVPDEAVQELLELMTSAESRLLIASREIMPDDASAPTVYIEVGHEALIREWERFNNWVADNKESLRYGSELMTSAIDWRNSGGDNAYLLTGNRLLRAEEWLREADATALQRDFIQASVEEEDRRAAQRQQQVERELALQRSAANRLRGFVIALVVGLVVAGALVVLTVRSEQEASNAQATAEANEKRAIESEQEARINAEQALSLALSAGANRAFGDNNVELAVLLAVEANQINNPPPQSQFTLAEVAYEEGTRRLFQPENSTITDAEFISATHQVLYAVEDQLILWNLETGTVERDFPGSNAYEVHHEGDILRIAIHPQGRLAASAGEDGRVIIWNLETSDPVQQLEPQTEAVQAIAYSPDGNYLLTGGADATVLLWSVASETVVQTFSGHNEPVNAVAFNRNGTQIVSGSDDDTARIWEIDGTPVRSIFIGNNVNDVAFAPNNDSIVFTASDDDTIIRWDVNSREPINEYSAHEGDVLDFALSADGTTLATASSDQTVILWDVENGTIEDIFAEHTDTVFDVDFSADDRFLVSASADGTARLWDVDDPSVIQLFTGHGTALLSRAVVGVYGPDDQTVLSGSYDDTLRLWDTASGLTIQEFLGHADNVLAVAMSSDGTTALSGSSDGMAILWDVASGQRILTLTGHNSPVQALAYLHDGQQAVSGARDGGLILWDLATGEILRRYGPVVAKDDIGHTDEVFDVVVSPDGRRMLSASADGNLLLWDIATGAVIRSYKGHNDEVVAVSLSPVDPLVAASGAANGSLIVWDISDDPPVFGGFVQRINAHDRAITDLDFSPDGSTVATGGQDRTLRLWDIDTLQELRRFEPPPDEKVVFRSVDFGLVGLKLLTGMGDGTLREWRVLTDTDDLLQWTYKNRFVPEPSCAERVRFQLEPQCEDGLPAPTRTPFPQFTPTPAPSVLDLTVGAEALINTTGGEPIAIFSDANGTELVGSLPDGTVVTLQDGPVVRDGVEWWAVSDGDVSGWVYATIPDLNLKTLVPRGML